MATTTKHTRYPLCDGSLDDVLGVVHMKDLLGVSSDDEKFDITTKKRPVHKVPEPQEAIVAAGDQGLAVGGESEGMRNSFAQLGGQLVPIGALSELLDGRLEISSQHDSPTVTTRWSSFNPCSPFPS